MKNNKRWKFKSAFYGRLYRQQQVRKELHREQTDGQKIDTRIFGRTVAYQKFYTQNDCPPAFSRWSVASALERAFLRRSNADKLIPRENRDDEATYLKKGKSLGKGSEINVNQAWWSFVGKWPLSFYTRNNFGKVLVICLIKLCLRDVNCSGR